MEEKMNIPALNHHVGSTERAFVAHVNDLNDFYLHSESVHESLLSLGQDLYKEYSESYTKPLGINEILNVGDYCACPSESEDWYRGLIRQFDANGHAIVFKIDYGDVQCIPIEYLRPLQERFFKLHRLAFHCSLVNLTRPINGWPLDVIEEFRSRLTTTFLYARFINYNEIRDISEVEITEKSSKTPLNKDFEQYQKPRPTLQMNDKLAYKYIPMEILDPIQANQIRLLYYISPSRFYVYLRDKTNSHTSFQIDLQKAIQNLHPISSPKIYQPIAAQDNHAVWHRAIILDMNADPSKIFVYFIDIGQREYISVNNIRPLPEEFQCKPAFAIPCCLNNVYPLNGNKQLIWESNDQVHDEFNRLMVNNVTCQVYPKQDQLYYDVDIDIPKIGDLSTFLLEKNLVSRPTMRSSQRPPFSSGQQPPQPHSFIRAQLAQSGISSVRQQQPARFSQSTDHYNNSNNMPQQQSTRMPNTGIQTATRQQSANALTTGNSSSAVPIAQPQDGFYKIIQVRSAAEFYGLSQKRESDFIALSKHLTDYYNNAPSDSLLNVPFFLEGAPCVIQEHHTYHRVIIKHRDTETRVSVKLVDRGDEIIVDTSELLQIDKQFSSIPAFAQPFRLHGFDESQSSASTTLSLKKMILDHSVLIAHKGPIVNGFYPVEVSINNQSVNRMLLSNDKNPSITSPPSNNRPNFNHPTPAYVESKVFSNSTRYHAPLGQDSSGRFDMNQRTNDALPTPQKILTGPPRTQPGRFGGGGTNPIPSSNEQIPRFSSISNRNQPTQVVDSSASNSMWNADQNNKPNFSSNSSGFSNQRAFGQQQQQQQQSGSSQFIVNNRMDENRTSIINSSNRLPSNNTDNQQPSFEQKRSYGGGYPHDDRNDRQTSGNNEGGFRRGAISSRGGFAERGGRGGYNDRNMGRNNEENNENNSASSGGFPKRTGGFPDRGGRGGGFYDRNGSNRNQGDNDSQNFNSNRGGFRGGRGGGGYQNRRDQGENGEFGRRGRGDSRGNFSSNRGGFGDRGGFGNRGNDELRLSSDNNPSKTLSGWPNTRSTTVNFEAGDRFIENEIPKETFKFVVSHIETANQFYIQLLSKGDELTALSEVLQNEFKQSPEGNLNSFKVNQPCLAKSSDNCWYRAIVLSTGVSKLKIRFIDFGDTTDVQSNTIRPIAKKHCAPPPYAYLCTFKNVQVVENVKNETIVNKCENKQFNGKILTKTSDGKFILESDELLNALVEINAIKLKSEVILKRTKCLIGHIESEKQEFYIQDDEETLDKITDLIQEEKPTASTFSLDEVKQLKPNTIVLATYEDELYRGIIQSNESDENVNICFVDFGNTSSCPKNSLQRASEQLSSYRYQAKHCRLHGVPSNQINNALTYLGDNTDPDNNFEISIINEKDQISNVLVYINNQCVNEKFGYDPNKDQSNTTVQEQPTSVPQLKTNEDVPPTNEGVPPTNEDVSPTNEDVSPTNEDVPPTNEDISPTDEDVPPTNEDVSPPNEDFPPTNEDVSTTNEDVPPTNEVNLETATVDESEIDETSSKYRQGLLTYIEKDKPYVYLQFYPESDPILDRINTFIGNVIAENKHNSSYEVGDYIIAKYTEDGDYYRAKIESYSSSSQLYTVYFLDYGNFDENVPVDHLYSYPDELKQIEPLAHKYLLNEINPETWNNIVQSVVEDHLNDIIEFYYSDENNSTIHVKFDNENEIYNIQDIPEQNQTFQANISATDNDCFYIHILPDGNLHACEMEEILQLCNREHKTSWSINDLCIVTNEENKFYRGQILAIHDNKYDVKCIDYGNTLQNITDDHLYELPDEANFKQSPLAHQCRLYGVNDENQIKAIEEVIKNIQTSERVTITVENNQDDPCLLVTLVRENNEIVNEQYSAEKNDITEDENKQEPDNDEKKPDSSDSDSAIVDSENTNEQSISQDEKVNQSNDPINMTENNSLLSITNNQTIDFGENDPSTTIKDETNNSITSN